jgi:hypothetical protein
MIHMQTARTGRVPSEKMIKTEKRYRRWISGDTAFYISLVSRREIVMNDFDPFRLLSS